MTGDEIIKVPFREKLRGYHPQDVDAFLKAVAAEVDAGQKVAPMVKDVAFRPKLRGYHPEDVERLLARLADQ